MPPNSTKGTIFNSEVYIRHTYQQSSGRPDRRTDGQNGSLFGLSLHQDKATPSLIGDVPRGVFLDRSPIFLGGQGGLVGPARVTYGTVIPAGTICRQDILEEGKIFAATDAPKAPRVFAIGIYRGINRIVANNLVFIGNLWALREWYRHVRSRTMSADVFRQACHIGALAQIDDSLKERVKRLKELADKMSYSLKHARAEIGEDLPFQIRSQQQALVDGWPEIEARLKKGSPAGTGAQSRDAFLKEWEQIDVSSGHCKAVSALNAQARNNGAAWLQAIVNSAGALWTKIMRASQGKDYSNSSERY